MELHLWFLVATLAVLLTIAMLVVITTAMGRTALRCLISLWPSFAAWKKFNILYPAGD
jgi:hypothetical protein